jgi:hypothetical protein
MKKKPNTHGGAGRNQGRKTIVPGEPSVVVSVRMSESQKDKLTDLGGSPWVRQRIDRAKVVE